jgi:DNA-binding XRE family transcriptional regulator
MSKGRLQEKQTTLSTAIRELRRALGVTQEGMARRLGCTLSGYIQWEKGRRVPGGEWLLKLMALCPDAETRSPCPISRPGCSCPGQLHDPRTTKAGPGHVPGGD